MGLGDTEGGEDDKASVLESGRTGGGDVIKMKEK
jgi:hypothetical protein